MGDEQTTPPATAVTPEEVAASPPAAKAPAEEWETRFKYLFADFENFRRRTERERESIGRQTRAALLRDLLPLIEAFRTAHVAAGRLPADDPLRQGVELLSREWEKFLKHQGLEPVAEVGRPFRSDEAEAVGEADPSATVPDGAVTEIVQQGYRFFGGLVRPAKVIVARGRLTPTAPEASAPGADTTKDEAA